MKLEQLPPLFALFLLLIVNGCNDDLVEKAAVEPPLIAPNLSVKVTSSVSGFVVDENNKPVMYAAVTAGNKRGTTDEFGYFKITNASLVKASGMVKVSKDGYLVSYRTFQPIANKETFVRLKLLTKKEVKTINATSGGTVTTTDGVEVIMPANAITLADENIAYEGTVHISARFINPSGETDNQLDRPGDSRGLDTFGHLKALKSFATIAVELTTDNGLSLQILAGKSATVKIPIPASLEADAPSTISLWSFDTTSGFWKQEGTATKTGSAYVGTVTHFSFWEAADGIPTVNFSAHIVNAADQPLANVPVSISIAGASENAGYSRFGYTDSNGNITGGVFANKDLVLNILTPCGLSAYSHEFSTAITDIDLGTLTGNLGQNVVTISGSVKNCDDQPVANGYVQTYDNGFYNRTIISNGHFTFTGLACANTMVKVIAVDGATYEQNIPESVTINPGVNDLGTLAACGTLSVGYITYVYDTIHTVTLTEPSDTIAAFSDDHDYWTQILLKSGKLNGLYEFAFQFTGGSALGSNHNLEEVYSTLFPHGRGYWPDGVSVTITEYGKVGGFISGSFKSNMLDYTDNSLHRLECTFKVRRHY